MTWLLFKSFVVPFCCIDGNGDVEFVEVRLRATPVQYS
jgi:hypothetical protein